MKHGQTQTEQNDVQALTFDAFLNADLRFVFL